MKRRGLWIVTTVVVVIVAIATFIMRRPSSTALSDEAIETVQSRDIEVDIRTDTVTEVLVELGDVTYSTTASKRVHLRNTTNMPLSLTSYRATCRCTWVELPHGTIKPGEWIGFDVLFDSRGEYGTVGNYIDITTSDDRCHIGVWVSAEVIY